MSMKEPKYEFVKEEGVEDVTPVKRKINKTMEITESFNYYDTLKYVMKMEKDVEDKLAEVEGMKTMIKAYRDEMELIDKELGVTKMEEEWNLALHEKLVEEAKKDAVEITDEKTND